MVSGTNFCLKPCRAFSVLAFSSVLLGSILILLFCLLCTPTHETRHLAFVILAAWLPVAFYKKVNIVNTVQFHLSHVRAKKDVVIVTLCSNVHIKDMSINPLRIGVQCECLYWKILIVPTLHNLPESTHGNSELTIDFLVPLPNNTGIRS
uniref:Uncharacterized protein n=1 Tax=Glossina brevipalpis TaxID=37001 RepID=A0A1A9W1F7_9MUSC